DLFNASKKYAGFIIDDWTEMIPEPEVNTGMAFHYDQPNSEAPNTILLAVPTQLSGSWNIEELIRTIEATIALAKKRAVDPDLIKKEFINQFLPAVFAGINQRGNAPSLDYGRTITAVDRGNNGLVLAKFATQLTSPSLQTSIEELGIEELFLDDDL
ncbi:MAG: hypothetical protein AAFO07_26085, partial [Bacteroidota bacterium]